MLPDYKNMQMEDPLYSESQYTQIFIPYYFLSPPFKIFIQYLLIKFSYLAMKICKQWIDGTNDHYTNFHSSGIWSDIGRSRKYANRESIRRRLHKFSFTPIRIWSNVKIPPRYINSLVRRQRYANSELIQHAPLHEILFTTTCIW